MSNEPQAAPDAAPVRTPARAHVAGLIAQRTAAEKVHQASVEAGHRAGQAGRDAERLKAKLELAYEVDAQILRDWAVEGKTDQLDLVDEERMTVMMQHARATALAAAAVPAQRKIAEETASAERAAAQAARRVLEATTPILLEEFEALSQEIERRHAEILPLHRSLIGLRAFFYEMAHGVAADDPSKPNRFKIAETVQKRALDLGVSPSTPVDGVPEAWRDFIDRLTLDADAIWGGA